MAHTIQLENLTIGYKKGGEKSTVISENISTELRNGELVCLLGPNGAGKSTLIRTLAGMQKPLAGNILIHGENVHALSKNKLAKLMSLVLTDRVYGGMLSAYEIVALGRYPHTDWSGRLSEKDHDKIRKAITVVGAEDLIHRSLSELSDGEKQKIMVARALAQDPKIMVLDEITAFLDLPRRIEIMQLMKRLASEENTCILLSSHDMELSLKYADRLWLMPKGGRLVTGAPEDLVLNGAFAKAFESEGIHFDMGKGAFETQTPYRNKVSLIGTGNEYIWTAKALERERIEVVDDADISVSVLQKKGEVSWRVKSKVLDTEIASIYELLKIIRDYD